MRYFIRRARKDVNDKNELPTGNHGSRREKSPRMRATRIKPRVKRALFAGATLGSREERRKPTTWALDRNRRCCDAGPNGKRAASITRSAGSIVVSRFPRVPLRA